MPVAVTDAEKAAALALLSWVALQGDWGRMLYLRAQQVADSPACQ